MAETTVSTALRVKQYDAKAHKAYLRSNRYKRYMGTGTDAIIQLKENLTKSKGDAVTFALVGALDDTGGPNDGSTKLSGNEKALPNDGHQISVKVVRDAVTVNVEEEQASPIAIREEGKDALKSLQMRYLRNSIEEALHSINNIAYATATELQKDAWMTDNADRILFGSAKANTAATHALSLANVDSVNDTLTPGMVSLAKRMAQTSSTANGEGIRPHTYGEDEETFVMFVPSLAFRDFRAALETSGDLRDAEVRGAKNPLWTGPTSLFWDGVMVREIPSLGVLAGVGTTGADVAPCFLCGAQALAVAWAKRTKTTINKDDDYEFQHGVGFMEIRGVEKLRYNQSGANPLDWGVVTVYASGVADA